MAARHLVGARAAAPLEAARARAMYYGRDMGYPDDTLSRTCEIVSGAGGRWPG
ncbi:MAG: hypothetical protein M0007_10935 [Actinomycetota bacterium]|jgi:hypothetical protein|nr:hypothetical protein [Actinomycetota bacterium]